jgi:D-galactonate transporter
VISTPRDVAVSSDNSAPAAALSRATIAKVGWRLLPFLLLLYIIAWIDRVNVGIAALTMNADIGLTDRSYSFGATLFFIAYAICEVPSNVVLAKVGARRWIARIMVTWGILSVAMLFVRGPVSFGVLRFLLGAAEAGFLPGIIYYLGHWFPSSERARAVSWFMLGIPLSGFVGNPIGGAILELNGLLGLTGWQWLFLLEGIPAVLLGFVVLFFLTDAPEEAQWLSPEQRDWLSRTMRAEQAAAVQRHRIDLKSALLHPTVLVLWLILFACQLCSYGLQLWIPQIVKSMTGLSNFETGLVAAIPYAAAAVGMVLIGRSSDRNLERRKHFLFTTVLAAAGLLVTIATQGNLVGSLAGLCLMAIGQSATAPTFFTAISEYIPRKTAACGIALISSLGNLGPAVVPSITTWINTTTGTPVNSIYFIIALYVLSGAILTFVLRPNAEVRLATA